MLYHTKHVPKREKTLKSICCNNMLNIDGYGKYSKHENLA